MPKYFTKTQLKSIYRNQPHTHENGTYQDADSQLFNRLNGLYGDKIMFCRDLTCAGFLGGATPATTEAASIWDMDVPIAAFAHNTNGWCVVAVFSVVDKLNRQPDRRLARALGCMGISYMQVPEHLIESGYLISADFKTRAKTALFNPSVYRNKIYPTLVGKKWVYPNEVPLCS